MSITQKISPYLWFDNQAEEAAKFYVSIFNNSKIRFTYTYDGSDPATSHSSETSFKTVGFTIDGQDFTALNGGPKYKLNEAVSFQIQCKNQQEIDYYWEKLTADGGMERPCGWLKDKFGLSWQVVPAGFEELMQNPDKESIARLTQALYPMKKIDIATLRETAKGQ